MAVISITLHKCLCFTSEHSEHPQTGLFRSSSSLFPNASHSICFISCASHLYFILPCQAMANFIPSSLHDVFCSTPSLLPFPGLPKMQILDATTCDRTRPGRSAALGRLLEVRFQGTPSVVLWVRQMCTLLRVWGASTKDRGAPAGRKSRPGKLITGLKARNCLWRVTLLFPQLLLKPCRKSANDGRQGVVILIPRNSAGFYGWVLSRF